MFSVGAYFKIWGATDKGSFTECECSSSKKNNQTGRYETDFSSKYVRFVGNAHKKRPQANERIKVTICAVQNVYEKDGQKQYLKNPTFLVFDFEREGEFSQNIGGFSGQNNSSYIPNSYGSGSIGFEQVEIAEESTLPF